ncbi:DinB family protein [Salipiger bermudensis]|uniref:DinB family protein n=1 Tax=Salipiger bermudensis (strain DSM 26914 / JCM 13377 / KCTC 12554 / HTCC2601) TaxID=314265 RepID=Q0FPV8_SALBH|nr:DinB family protein [Salipiger bermudensis]EAU46296.1 DinB family protein [Salipiger bermudensis HTCC2601]
MLSPDYVLSMARYNAWQNRQMKAALEALPEAELRRDRGAFFGSIFATVNHLLWADAMWMSRFADWPKPDAGIDDSTTLVPTLAVWGAERFRADARILLWAERLGALDLTGDLRWSSGATGRVQVRPLGQCLAHMFNHQTHHRGQVHAMATAAGGEGWVSDLAFMPGEGPWL